MEPIDENGYFMKKFEIERLIDKKIKEALEGPKVSKVEFECDGPHCGDCYKKINGSYGRYCDYCGVKLDWND